MELTQSSTPAKRRTTRAADRLTLDLVSRLQLAQVASRFRTAREQAGLTQEQMADIVGVHKRVIENVENNRLVKGPFQYINAWSEATGVSVRELLHGAEPAPANAELGTVAAQLSSAAIELVAVAQEMREFLQDQREDPPEPAEQQ